ncbi:MAG TPA: DNA-processing protein DprA [Mycobacteriales bacterium]|nr:DNA-processing protein DprA [Mycobacteriales bacterium]
MITVTGPPADAERVARAVLLRVTEPAIPGMVRHIRAVGCVQAVEDIRRGAPIGQVDVAALQQRILDASGERDLAAAARLGARLVCPGDAEWPFGLDDLLRRDADCLALWVRGPLSLRVASERAVAVVGTRAATDYGLSVAADLGAGLGERGWTVVSGLAFGIDAAAHRGALSVAGATVAVLACGVDVAYPRAHRSLYDQIVESGLAVSEHPPGAAPQRARFLVRNRLIAALSAGTVVVEAAPRSGARSTARHAGELFRHVMAVPGPITSTLSAGCHQLLRDRPDAVLVTKTDEVLEQVGAMGEFAERVSGPVRRRDLLGPAVSRVLDAVPVIKRAPAGRIATTAGMRVDAVEAALAALSVHGLVENAEGGWAMTTLGRAERRAGSGDGGEELVLGWW